MQSNFQKQLNEKVMNKIAKISLSKRAFTYLFMMGVVGAVAGGIDSKVALNECLDTQECSIDEFAEPEIHRIGIGACAGMVAASIISLPAMLNEE